MSASRVGHCLLSDPAGNFEKRLDFWVAALRVGHCLLSDLAGKFEKLLTSGCLPLAWVTACFQTLQVILKSVLTFGVCSSRSSTSLYYGPLEEVKIKTVWSQDLGIFWSQDLELVELV